MPTTLILTMVGLLFLLIALVFIYVWIGRTRKSTPHFTETVHTFESLSAIIDNRASKASELHRAVDLIVKNFSSITPHTMASYRNLIETLCVHPNTDSKLILRFERALRAANPQLSDDIEHALRRGLAARG